MKRVRAGMLLAITAALAAAAAVVVALRDRPRSREGPAAHSSPQGGATKSDDGPNSSTAGDPAAARSCPIRLHDVTAQTGIGFRHTDGSSGRHYIVETITSGLALLDYDGDGQIDIYFPNGAPLPGTTVDKPPRHALYRNRGGWRFDDVTEAAGVGCTAYGVGAVAGDFDNDGHTDLYVSNFGPKVLYRNNGDGTFTDVTARAGVADGNKIGAGACFLDYDGDGDLDLFVANYVHFTYENHVAEQHGEFPEYAGPKRFGPERFALYHNTGDGMFTDVTDASGIGAHLGKGMGVVAADYNRDGRPDIFVLNDVFGNFCFRNEGDGRFTEQGLSVGFMYNGQGKPLGSMGVDCADYDNDGWLDFYQTSYEEELPVLFRNIHGILEDVTLRTGAGSNTRNNVKWGCGFVDFDNDGHRDLFIAMGHLQDFIDRYSNLATFKARNVLLRNRGDGTFEDVSDRCGDGLQACFSSRGAAFDDLDNDGDIDVVVLNARDPPTVLRNMYYERGGANHWLQIVPRGVKTNAGGVGAWVRVVAGPLTLVDEVHSGRGYQSHWGSRLHFGLGSQRRVDRIEIYWPGGGVQVLQDVSADRILTVTESADTGR
jgi:hypothetical protein